jgi:excisionase family DNA binding protein
MEEKLLTPEEQAEKLRVKLSWIYAQTRQKKIPFVKIGKYIRFREKEVDDWLRAQK